MTTGPKSEAYKNIETLILDAGLTGVHITQLPEDGTSNDLTPFLLRLGVRRCKVLMSSQPLDKNLRNGEFTVFPRTYVDGNSWFWEFAVTNARESLTVRDPETRRVLKNAAGHYLREWVTSETGRVFALEWVPAQKSAHKFRGDELSPQLKNLKRAFKATTVKLTPVAPSPKEVIA